MRLKTLALVVSLIAAVSECAYGSISIYADCHDQTVTVVVDVYVDPNIPTTWTGLVVYRSYSGACNTEHLITPEPLAIPDDPWGWVEYTLLDDPPEQGKYFLYQVFAIDEYEGLVPVGGDFDLSYAACGVAVLTRGYLTSTMSISPCPDDCWPLCPFLYTLDPAFHQYVGTGQIVDIYGIIGFGMIPPCIIHVDSVAIFGETCGPIPAQRVSWGAAKSLYR